MTRALIAATYLLFCATIGTTVFLFAGAATGILTGAVLSLGAIEIHSAFLRRREKKITEKEIAGLKRVSFHFEQALDETRTRIDEMNAALEAKTNAQGRKIVAELQVLESLMRDFASKVSNSAKNQPVADEIVERRQTGSVKAYLEPLGESTCSRPSAPRSNRTASISISSRSSACRSASCASMRRCRACAPKTARSSCRNSTSRSPRRPVSCRSSTICCSSAACRSCAA